MIKDANSIYYIYNDGSENKNCKHIYFDELCAPEGAKPIPYHIGDISKVRQPDGSTRTAYFYGEYTWSYDKKELEAYRAECRAEYEELKRYNRAVKKLTEYMKQFSIEELEAKIQELGL